MSSREETRTSVRNPGKPSGEAIAGGRDARLSAALRANLRRRKAAGAADFAIDGGGDPDRPDNVGGDPRGLGRRT
ncbi:MAG: hypothetical protein GC152_12750 [Alphaproteobacteria bacterium]|nr:hypothetical protein [Alphaproteobacteria bacterium]